MLNPYENHHTISPNCSIFKVSHRWGTTLSPGMKIARDTEVTTTCPWEIKKGGIVGILNRYSYGYVPLIWVNYNNSLT